MITYIKINGFKSFHHFEMEFTPLTVVAGANASGKSNLFDALKLLGRLAEETVHIKKAFKEQRGEFIELFTQYGENDYATEIAFVVEMLVNRKVKDSWGNEAELKYTRLRYELKIKRFTNSLGIEDLAVTYEHLENLKPDEDKWVRLLPEEIVENWRPNVNRVRTVPYIKTETENNRPTVLVSQEGMPGANKRFPLNNATRTVLSSFDTVDFPHVLAAKEEMRRWKFLQLNPEDLRQPTHKNTGDDVISESGQNLAAVLHRIKQEELYTLREISRDFQTFLPHFVDVDVIDDSENKQYLIKLTDKDKKEYTSRVLSEGTLRILALCILEYDSKHTGLLCFEEPENGIPPFRIETMAKLLKHLSVDFTDLEMPLRQVIVNTHSPVLVGMMNRWEPDLNVNIWYAEMRDRVTDIQKKRVKLSVTSILPVINDKMPLMLIFSEQEKKLTLSKLKRYLETASNQS
jgi:predicted ATPase